MAKTYSIVVAQSPHIENKKINVLSSKGYFDKSIPVKQRSPTILAPGTSLAPGVREGVRR